MKIIFKSKYIKQYEKLQPSHKAAVKRAIDIFQNNPFDPGLRNHALIGKLLGFRSLDAGYDLRLIFREEDGYAVVCFVAVGSHNQIYG